MKVMAVKCPKCQAYTANDRGHMVVSCAACGESIDALKYNSHERLVDEGGYAWAWDDDRQTVADRPDARRYPVGQPTMADLEKHAATSGVVKLYLDLWRRGAFASLERMLVSLACHLAAENQALLQRAVFEAYKEPPLRGAYPAWAASREKQPAADQPVTVEPAEVYGVTGHFVDGEFFPDREAKEPDRA